MQVSMPFMHAIDAFKQGIAQQAAAAGVCQVVEGMDVVKAVEGTPTGAMDKPKAPCTIADCGEL